MKKIISYLTFSFLLMGCNPPEYADLLLINGYIYTMDSINPVVEAVGVRDGIISFVGKKNKALKLKGENTAVVDLDGKLMTPGLIEGHGHFMGLGYSQLTLDLLKTKSFDEIVEMVRMRVAESESGDWIVGRGWHQSKWDFLPAEMYNGFPTHIKLSEVSPENPVVLKHASGHAMLANAKAMEIAGIDRNLPEINGGEVVTDNNGNPTGLFIESAMGLISRIIPENDRNTEKKAYRKAVECCLMEGITSFHDAGTDSETIHLYQEMMREEAEYIRLYVMLNGSDSILLERYFSSGPQIDTVLNKLTIRAIKLYMDGALGSWGAWLLESYDDRPGFTGHMVSSLDNISLVCNDALLNGFQVCTHAIGDRANQELLNIYESVINNHPDKQDCRFRIEHAQHLSKEDIPRFGELGIIPAMQAIHLSSDRPWAIDRLGEKRIKEGAYVWQKLILSGARIVNGTDVPVEPLSPINCFYASITRKTLNGLPQAGYEPGQRMTRDQALKSYTIDAAFGAFEEGIKGSIELGKLADFTVFSKNIMTIPESEILNTTIQMTIIGGKIVYQSN